jgi:hypothetical protein
MREAVNINDFRVDKTKVLEADGERSIYRYDSEGSLTDKDNIAVAKKSENEATGVAQYFIRFTPSGMNAGDPYDPQKQHQEETKRFDATKGGDKFPFRRVTEESFNHYIRFLRTGNPVHLRLAARAN